MNDDIVAMSLEGVIDEIYSSTFQNKPGLQAWEKTKGATSEEAGELVRGAVLVEPHSTGVEVVDESAALDLNNTDVSKKITTDWSLRYYSLQVGIRTKLLNSGPEAIMNVYQNRLEQQMEQASQELNQRLLSNPDSSIFEDLITLNGMSAGDGSSTGVFEGLAFGSQTNVLGSGYTVSKATYPEAWQHQYASAGGAFATSGLQGMSSIIKRCKAKNPDGGKPPDIGILSSNCWDLTKKALAASGQGYTLVDPKRADLGFGEFMYDKVPLDMDLDLENEGGATTTLISGYFLTLKHLKLVKMRGAWFTLTKPQNATTSGYLGDVGSIGVGVALLPLHLASQGVLVHGEA